jgi:hypothetical protein
MALASDDRTLRRWTARVRRSSAILASIAHRGRRSGPIASPDRSILATGGPIARSEQLHSRDRRRFCLTGCHVWSYQLANWPYQ